MLCGHLHSTEIFEVGSSNDNRGQACPVIIGSDLKRFDGGYNFAGAGIVLEDRTAKIVFNEPDKVREETVLEI